MILNSSDVSVVLDLQSNTIYYQDLQSANIFVVNDIPSDVE